MTVDMFKDDRDVFLQWGVTPEPIRYKWIMENASRVVAYEGSGCPLSAVSGEWRSEIAEMCASRPRPPQMLGPIKAEMTQALWTRLSEHERLLWPENDDNNTAVLAHLAKQPSPPVMTVEAPSYNEPPGEVPPLSADSTFAVFFGAPTEPKSAFVEAAKTWLQGNMSRKLRIEYNDFSGEGEPPHVSFRITSNGVSQATGIRGDEARTDAGWTQGLKLAIDLLRERFS